MEKQQLSTPKKKLKLQQLVQFQQVSTEWIKSNPDNFNTELTKCIMKVMQEASPYMNSLRELDVESGKRINESLLLLSEQHIIEQSNNQSQQQQVSHRHIFTHKKRTWYRKEKDTYKEFTSIVEVIGKESQEKKNKLLQSEIEITPCYCTSLPNFKTFPESIQELFKGIVIKSDEEK